MASLTDEYASLKAAGNELFMKGDFAQAEEMYTLLLLKFEKDHAILLTNRSAARLSLGKIEEAKDDAEQAITLDKKWIKAYHRKAAALEKLNRPKDVFDTWMEAAKECDSDSSPWLSKQVNTAKCTWVKAFRDVAVVDAEDFIVRYGLLTDSREKLSTMAHFWNDSTLSERLHTFQFLTSLVKGETELSTESRDIAEENMPSMPLHNYLDLPRSAVELWCNFFLALSSQSKTNLMEQMWETLTSIEQNAVITDLRQFINMAMQEDLDYVVEKCRHIAPGSGKTSS